MDNLNLTEDQKKSIIDEANLLPEEAVESGLETTISYAADEAKLVEQIANMNPQELFEKNVASSYRSLMKLDQQLIHLSKRNIIKLIQATLKLPEEGMRVNFGGTPKERQKALEAFVQLQVARNSFVFVVGTQAVFKAKLANKHEQEIKNESK